MTQTSITPSPNHLAIRTPRRAQMSRRSIRNAVSTSTARSSPSVSVSAVNPETSTNPKVRWTRTATMLPCARPDAPIVRCAAKGRHGWPRPTMAPWLPRISVRARRRRRRVGPAELSAARAWVNSTTRWCC